MIFSFDLDGTILDTKHNIHKDNIKSIKKAKDMGHIIVFNSGRPYSSIIKFNKENLVNYIVSNNGATTYCVESKKFIDTNLISKKVLTKTYDLAKKRKNFFSVSSTKRYYHYDFADDESNQSVAIEKDKKNIYEDLNKFNKAIDDVKKITQVTFSNNKPIPVKEFDELVKGFTEVSPVLSNFRFFDVVAKGVNKYNALKKIMAREGFTNNKLITFGDSMNDYEMIKFAGKGYAMSNACDEIKKVATKIIGDRDSNTISVELEKLI